MQIIFRYIYISLFLFTTMYAAQITDNIRLQGFFTGDATYSDTDNIPTFLPNGKKENLRDGLNYNHTLFGLQLEVDATDDLSFAVQGVLTRSAQDEDYLPNLEWAYLAYDFGSDFNLKIGRMKVPFLKGIELRYIGYSRLWTRPQIPSSGLNGFDEYDGADLLYNTYAGDFDLEFELSAGVANHTKESIEDNYLVLLAAQVDYDRSWIRAAIGYNNYNLPRMKNNDMAFASIETEINLDNFVFNAGYTYTYTDIIPNDRLLYTSLGYHFGDFTPYILYNRKSLYFPTTPPPPRPGAAPKPASIELEQDHSVGLRYDIIENVDLKLQYNYKTLAAPSSLKALENDNVNIYTFAIDWVF